MNERIADEYKGWLIGLCADWLADYGSYYGLLNYLYSKEFYATIRSDENRISDGTRLRFRFVEDDPVYTYADVYLYLEKRPCSVLEMMMGLAMRCEEHVMTDIYGGDYNPGKWLYGMFTCMHVEHNTDDFYNDDEVVTAVTKMLDRKYSKNGDGGLFLIHDKDRDMRKTEIWYQLMWYLNEVIYGC